MTHYNIIGGKYTSWAVTLVDETSEDGIEMQTIEIVDEKKEDEEKKQDDEQKKKDDEQKKDDDQKKDETKVVTEELGVMNHPVDVSHVTNGTYKSWGKKPMKKDELPSFHICQKDNGTELAAEPKANEGMGDGGMGPSRFFSWGGVKKLFMKNKNEKKEDKKAEDAKEEEKKDEEKRDGTV